MPECKKCGRGVYHERLSGLCATCELEVHGKNNAPADPPEHEARIEAHEARVQADLDAVRRKRQEQGLDTEELKPSTAYFRAKKRKSATRRQSEAERVRELKLKQAGSPAAPKGLP